MWGCIMSVVNCKVQFIRKEGFHNLKEWMANPNNVYIGRPGVVFIEENGKKERFPKKGSSFCNPFVVGKHGSREEVIAKYKVYIKDKLQADPELERELKEMKGKNLGCWCHPEACHGDVLLDLLKD